MKLRKQFLICTFAALAAGTTLVGCDDRDGFEDAGEKIDESLEKAGDKIEDAVEETGEAIEETGDKVKDATDGKP